MNLECQSDAKSTALKHLHHFVYAHLSSSPHLEHHPKNKDGRVLVLIGEIANIIARRRAERVESCPYVFHRNGVRIKHYNRVWRTARMKAGLSGKLMHDNRRTAARNMDRAGVPRQIAKQITGHKTDSMYNRYNIVNEKDVREGLAQAQAYLAVLSGQNLDNLQEQKIPSP